MSKIAFTVAVPHEGRHVPQFSISCQNATFLSFKGKDIGNARFGNGNLTPKKGWKRLEFGVTGSSAATRFSVLLNTSVVLPPVAWSTPGPAPAASVARGGSLPTKKDLKDGTRKVKHAIEGKEPLRIESGRDRDERRSRYGEDEDARRARRGERVRRSDRRREETGRRFDDESRADENEYEYISSRRSRHGDGAPRREFGRDRRGNGTEDELEDDTRYQRRTDNSLSESGSTSQRRVTGKKINPKYHKPNRHGGSVDWHVEESPERNYHNQATSKASRRHHTEAERMHRRKGRRDPYKPVDYAYYQDDDDNDNAVGLDAFDGDAGVAAD